MFLSMSFKKIWTNKGMRTTLYIAVVDFLRIVVQLVASQMLCPRVSLLTSFVRAGKDTWFAFPTSTLSLDRRRPLTIHVDVRSWIGGLWEDGGSNESKFKLWGVRCRSFSRTSDEATGPCCSSAPSHVFYRWREEQVRWEQPQAFSLLLETSMLS